MTAEWVAEDGTVWRGERGPEIVNLPLGARITIGRVDDEPDEDDE